MALARRLRTMVKQRAIEQPPLLDDEPADCGAELERLRQEVKSCRACPLWEIGTQTVFGEGPVGARLMLVGEAPGRDEDLQGRPFVGASGRLLDEALRRAELERAELYVTNTVKHRPWLQQGSRQKNRAPKQSEINACRPWLSAELRLVRPALIVCLGATAARELLGKDFKLTQQRGQWHDGPGGAQVLATLHPSYVLIQPPETQEQVREGFFADIRAAAERYRKLANRA
jgi:uracil-DNA glycosylase